jgi:branched-chain amino acid transport system permease protein
MNYLLHIVIMCDIYIILALGMNLLAGYSGLLAMSQAAYYGIGAYFTALLLTKTGFSFPYALFGAVLFNMVCCIPIIWFSIRLRNLFFILSTLAWQMIVFSILHNWISLTSGPYGISNIPKPELLGFTFSSLAEFALLAGIIGLFIIVFFTLLHKSPLSRFFQGGRDDQLALITFGKRPSFYKALAILISSGTSAVAGSLFATYFSYIDPTSFTIDESILIISIVLIGGLGSIKGSVTGAVFYVVLPEILRFISIPDPLAANTRMMIYGLILIIIVLFRPHGFFGKYKLE